MGIVEGSAVVGAVCVRVGAEAEPRERDVGVDEVTEEESEGGG